MIQATEVPHFIVKNKFQKNNKLKYSDILTDDVLADISSRLTGQKLYTITFDDEGYNKGRLVIMHYGGIITYISIAETEVRSRNSSFQSFTTAYSMFSRDNNPKGDICYYIIQGTVGNIETDYFIFMYRLMKTAGVKLINLVDYVSTNILPFNAAEDVILAKEKLRKAAKGNRSTYVTKGSNGAIQIFAKTYGANKYESSLLCFALVKLTSSIELFQIEEGGLTALPQATRDALALLGHVIIKTSNETSETEEFKSNNSLRSIRFIYNILERFGAKKCLLCDCEIPQIVQGAHIWPVASIKASIDLELKVQLNHAINGSNGMWLCENHHKLFDSNILSVTSDGTVLYIDELDNRHVDYLKLTTTRAKIGVEFLTDEFIFYLSKRNSEISIDRYRCFEVIS
ncbi:HNH endonuclease signature motif containing protein [Brucella intermedia]|uniref:HNH endonuclease signature motif containing protein n=1 Tax=Brucella intermedia TaxID=94625 RepID=UPI0022493337|nr:HNH endonuclease signature motif containing protein [Brucella intermedia]